MNEAKVVGRYYNETRMHEYDDTFELEREHGYEESAKDSHAAKPRHKKGYRSEEINNSE
jgi:hypothetical protein